MLEKITQFSLLRIGKNIPPAPFPVSPLLQGDTGKGEDGISDTLVTKHVEVFSTASNSL